MGLNSVDLFNLLGDPKPKASPGLTGADLEQAKAEAELAAADKHNLTAKERAFRTFPPRGADDAYHASFAPMGDAASNVANIANARNPEGETRLRAALDALRRLIPSPRP